MVTFGFGRRLPEQEGSGPPPNMLPGVVPEVVPVARNADTAVSVVWIAAYPTGVELTVDVRVRPGSTAPDSLPGHRAGSGPGADFDVEFADDSAGVPSLDRPGWRGDATGYRLSYWLHPLPPAGPLTLVARFPSRGLADARVTIDADAIRAAARDAVELWPAGPGLPEPGTPPDDAVAAVAAIRAAFNWAFTGGQEGDATLAAVEDGPALRATLAEARAYFPVPVSTARVTTAEIVFVSPTAAALTFRVSYEGGINFAEQVGHAVLDDGVWKVRRDTYCTVLSWTGAQCPPAADHD